MTINIKYYLEIQNNILKTINLIKLNKVYNI